tara:strand:+ start:370 stop:573 length:204 start_codon:yes stop_codon:yes gene_type:complete
MVVMYLIDVALSQQGLFRVDGNARKRKLICAALLDEVCDGIVFEMFSWMTFRIYRAMDGWIDREIDK